MRTELCRKLGLEAPIFAFARSREVVVEVSRAGGLGVLGAISYSPEELDEHLAWIDERVEGKPYGVDTVMPMSYAGRDQGELTKDQLGQMIPDEHRRFVDDLMKEHRVPALPPDHEAHEDLLGWSLKAGMAHIEVSLEYPIKLIANALGTPPPEAIEQAHAKGVQVAALCGKTEQAVRHQQAGVDVIVAQGWEAGGHTGEVAGMVLCPEVVDAVGDTPVLMAGGIGSGRQMAAALALGAQGVWLGSIWLTTEEHTAHNPAGVTDKLVRARSTDTTRSRALSGKPARQLKTAWTEAWAAEGAPKTLPIPLQWMLQAEAMERVFLHGSEGLAGSPVGQIVGRMNAVQSTRTVMEELVRDYREAVERLRSYEG